MVQGKSQSHAHGAVIATLSSKRFILPLVGLSCVSALLSALMMLAPSVARMRQAHTVKRVAMALDHGGLMHNRQFAEKTSSSSVKNASVWAMTSWNEPLSSIRCRKTQFSPYIAGCPASCDARRRDVPPDEPLYRMDVAWDFGLVHSSTQEFNAQEQQQQDPIITHGFLNISKQVQQGLPPGLEASISRSIRLDLFNFCCLTKNETMTLSHILDQWIHSTEQAFNIPVTFDKTECWQTSPHSISSILIPDDASQRKIYREVYIDILQRIKDAGIPVPLRREEQMPFNTPIATIGVQGEEEEEGEGGASSVDRYKIQIASLTNRRMINNAIMTTNLDFKPKLTGMPQCHDRCAPAAAGALPPPPPAAVAPAAPSTTTTVADNDSQKVNMATEKTFKNSAPPPPDDTMETKLRVTMQTNLRNSFA